jgi:hypothetical protein
LAHVCPYLRDHAPGSEKLDKIPRKVLDKLLAKCPKLAHSPQAKQHVASALLGEDAVPRGLECPYLVRPGKDASVQTWEEFYQRSAECPWIQQHGVAGLSKSPKAWEAALEVFLVLMKLIVEMPYRMRWLMSTDTSGARIERRKEDPV